MGSANLRPAKPRDPWQTGKLAINEFITWIAARVSIARHVCHAWPRTWQTGKLVNNDYGCFRLMRAAGLSPTIRQSTRDRALPGFQQPCISGRYRQDDFDGFGKD